MYRQTLLIISLIFLTQCQLDYGDQGSWGGSCQTGGRQSPIDIVTDDAQTGSNHRFEARLFDGSSYLNPSGIDLKNSFSGSSLSMVDGDS